MYFEYICWTFAGLTWRRSSQSASHSKGCFRICAKDDVARVVAAAVSKSCELDPIPTDILKQFLSVSLPCITKMCNASLQRGSLPMTQRNAIVASHLKKTGSDPADVRNYRPISNLAFMSKVVERLVCRQLVAYLKQNGLLPDLLCLQALSVDRDWRFQNRRWPPHSRGSRRSYTSQSARFIRCFWHCRS